MKNLKVLQEPEALTASGQLGMLDAEFGQYINKGKRIGQLNVLYNLKINTMIVEHYMRELFSNKIS